LVEDWLSTALFEAKADGRYATHRLFSATSSTAAHDSQRIQAGRHHFSFSYESLNMVQVTFRHFALLAAGCETL
jgi:hypothetical protein